MRPGSTIPTHQCFLHFTWLLILTSPARSAVIRTQFFSNFIHEEYTHDYKVRYQELRGLYRGYQLS
jgi:hypothetical protein